MHSPIRTRYRAAANNAPNTPDSLGYFILCATASSTPTDLQLGEDRCLVRLRGTVGPDHFCIAGKSDGRMVFY